MNASTSAATAKVWHPDNNTGVSGINYVKDYVESKRGVDYHYPVFRISAAGARGRVVRRVRIRDGKEREAWRIACAILSAAKSGDGNDSMPMYKTLCRKFPKHLF